MAIAFEDSAVMRAVAHQLGHPAPFGPDEIAAMPALRITGAGSLSDLQHCTGLKTLELTGCDVDGLSGVSGLKQLEVLWIRACPIRSAQGLAGLDALTELRIDFAFLEDPQPILELRSLQHARLIANAWTPQALDRLRRHALDDTGPMARRPILEIGADADASSELNRQMRALGLDLAFGKLDALRGVLVRPGRSRRPDQPCEWTSTSSSRVWLDERGKWTTDRYFDSIVAARDRAGETPFDFDSHRMFGDAAQASEWIRAEADPLRRANYAQFIARFPTAVFHREDDRFISMIEQRAGISFPAEHRSARQVLAGAHAEWASQFRPDRFALETPASTSLAEGLIWYRLGFESYDNDEGPVLRDDVRVFPIGSRPGGKHSVLAVSLRDADASTIVEYDEMAVFDLRRSGRDVDSVIFPAYADWASMLARIAAWKLRDGTVIEARSLS